MKNELQTYLERPKRYDNIDGTGEIIMGLMLLAFALIGYLQPMIPPDSFWHRHGLLFMYAILLPMLGLGFLLQKSIKRNLTFPRTGYVAFPQNKKLLAAGMLWVGVLGAVIAVLFAIIFIPLALIGRTHHLTMNITRILYAALLILPYGFWLCRMGKGQPWKWFIFGFMVIALAAVVVMVPGGVFETWCWVALLAGVSWIFSGGTTLISYLRHNKGQVPEAE